MTSGARWAVSVLDSCVHLVSPRSQLSSGGRVDGALWAAAAPGGSPVQPAATRAAVRGLQSDLPRGIRAISRGADRSPALPPEIPGRPPVGASPYSPPPVADRSQIVRSRSCTRHHSVCPARSAARFCGAPAGDRRWVMAENPVLRANRAARSLLTDVVALARQAPTLAEDQLRTALATLGSLAARQLNPRPAYDPWRDAAGEPVPVGARVEQIEIAPDYGALRSRLHQRGEVISRRGCRLYIRFDGEQERVSIRPHLVRVVPLSIAHIITQLDSLHRKHAADLADRGRPGHSAPDPGDRMAKQQEGI